MFIEKLIICFIELQSCNEFVKQGIVYGFMFVLMADKFRKNVVTLENLGNYLDLYAVIKSPVLPGATQRWIFIQ